MAEVSEETAPALAGPSLFSPLTRDLPAAG